MIPEGVNLKAVRLRALHGVVKETADWQIRHIFRWYSRTFHTPLHVVESLDFEDILLAYWEEHYENLEDPQIQEAIYELSETPEEEAARKLEENSKATDDDEFLKMAQKRAAEAAKVAPVPSDTPEVPLTPPPDVSVSFVDTNLLKEFGDLDPFGAKPPRPG